MLPRRSSACIAGHVACLSPRGGKGGEDIPTGYPNTLCGGLEVVRESMDHYTASPPGDSHLFHHLKRQTKPRPRNQSS